MKTVPNQGIAPTPPNERDRLEALRAYRILDTDPERAYDDITMIASHVCATPIALISLVDEGREWFKSSVGLEVSEIPRHLAFCAHAILKPYQVMVVEDAVKDERFRDNPLVTGDLHIRFYAAVPLTTQNGHALGTLCVIDRVPRTLDDAQLEVLSALGRQVVRQFETRRSFDQLNDYRARLELLNRELKVRSLTDDLTRLWNHAAFERRLGEETARARRNSEPIGLLFIDIDHFKDYNDHHGHPEGDRALTRIASLISGATREQDFEARYGGEEFVVLLSNTGRGECLGVAERVRVAVESADWPRDRVTVSIGVAVLSGDAAEGEVLVSIADERLYRAKAKGRNCVVAE